MCPIYLKLDTLEIENDFISVAVVNKKFLESKQQQHLDKVKQHMNKKDKQILKALKHFIIVKLCIHLAAHKPNVHVLTCALQPVD